MITRDTPVEEFIEKPGVIAYCVKNGVSPYSCSGDYPCSLGRLLETAKLADADGFIAGLNDVLQKDAV